MKKDAKTCYKKLSYTFLKDKKEESGSIFADKTSFLGDGVISVTSEGIRLVCEKGRGAYQLKFNHARMFVANTISVRLKVINWEDLSYVAIGFTDDNKFVHVKINHIKQDEWVDFKFSFHDLIFLIQNDWKMFKPKALEDLRVFVKGVPADDCGQIIVSELAYSLESDVRISQFLPPKKKNKNLIDVIYSYWKKCYREYAEQADLFLQDGSFPAYGDNNIVWPFFNRTPFDLRGLNTYRYSWHALHSVSMLLLRYEDTKKEVFLYSIRELVSNWLESSFYNKDPDQKYAWYDHGAAERTLVLLVLWQLSDNGLYDARYRQRLGYALFKHVELLYSEAFYASHQNYRYHNHAWFQDIALLAASIGLQSLADSKLWQDRAIVRLTDQLSVLINRESDFAIFVENSIGYHQGVERLVQFAGDLEGLVKKESEILNIANELNKWTCYFQYPDGRIPAQGDTFRKPNSLKKEFLLSDDYSSSISRLPKSGYAVFKGGSKDCPWFFGLLGTNLNSTHKHNDDLSFVLWLDGVEWFIDPSFLSHEYKQEKESFLRSEFSHNTIGVSGCEYEYKPSAERVTMVFDDDNAEDRLSVMACNKSYKNIMIERQLICRQVDGMPAISSNDKVSISNAEYDSNGSINKQAVLTFHIGDGVDVEMVEDDGIYTVKLFHCSTDRKLNLSFLNNNDSLLDVVLEDSFSGLGFMKLIPTKILKVIAPVTDLNISWNVNVQ